MSTVEFHPSKTLEPGSDWDRSITIKAAPANNYQGLLKDTKARPEAIGDMWYPRVFDPAKDKYRKIILHFHGGAYVLDGVRPLEGGYLPEQLAKHVDGLALLQQYRLAWQEEGVFPAPTQDAITAYLHLLSLGVPASQIVVSGDSAGGNLALILLRYLKDHPVVPLPGTLWLWSPWLDLTPDGPTLMAKENRRWDWAPAALVDWGKRLYIPEGMSTTHPYLSPLGNEFKTKVPIFLQTAELEVLHDSHKEYVDRIRALDNKIKMHNVKYRIHDAVAITPLLGTVAGSELVVAKSVEFIAA